MSEIIPNVDQLHGELVSLISSCRQQVAAAVNSELTLLYWMIGERLSREVLGGDRAAYGSRLIEQIGNRLSSDFGRGFETKNLRRMMGFADTFPDQKIVATLSRQLGWSHFKEILPLKNADARAWYARTAGDQRWSVRHLRQRIEAKDYERTALSALRQGQPESALLSAPPGEPAALTPALVFKDPLFPRIPRPASRLQ